MAPRPSCGRDLDVAIIGAGFGGLAAAIKLQEAGCTSFTIYEQADGVGGTWRANTYPGCACDIPSHLYSLSFDLNPDWSRSYPLQPEILTYLQGVTDRHGLWPHLQLETTITEVRFDDTTARWVLHTSDGETHEVDVVINSTGLLTRPAVPELAGIEQFEGEAFHSAHWRSGHDLTGERVAVIGTGASAIQIVPEIAPITEHVTVFQRTPPWVLPRFDGAFTDQQRRRFRRFPLLTRLLRWRIYLRQELLAFLFVGGRSGIADRVADAGRWEIAKAIDDPDLRAAVTPDYAPGCKRLLISNDWYPTLARDDVDLVTAGIAEVRSGSIVTTDGVEHPVDTIVYGTGFVTTEYLTPMKVFGVAGVELSEAWRDGAVTHLGVAAPGFPNFFLLLGPNTALGHNSVVFMVEAQLHLVMGAITQLADRPGVALEVRPEVAAASYADVQQRMQKTVWMSGCHSWYQSADGHIDTLWPGFSVDYWRRTRRFDAGDFREVAPAT